MREAQPTPTPIPLCPVEEPAFSPTLLLLRVGLGCGKPPLSPFTGGRGHGHCQARSHWPLWPALGHLSLPLSGENVRLIKVEEPVSAPQQSARAGPSGSSGQHSLPVATPLACSGPATGILPGRGDEKAEVRAASPTPRPLAWHGPQMMPLLELQHAHISTYHEVFMMWNQEVGGLVPTALCPSDPWWGP